MIREIIIASLAALSLAACQASPEPVLSDPHLIHIAGVNGPKPTVILDRSIPVAKADAIAVFTSQTQAFHIVNFTENGIMFSKTLPANVNDNNPLKSRTVGEPVTQIELTFEDVNGMTRVTGNMWMLLNPNGVYKDKFNLLATPDGNRFQNKLNEMR